MASEHPAYFFADGGPLLVAAVIAAFFVIRFGPIGFFIGIITVWAFGIVRIELLYRIDPQRDAAMLDAAWVVMLGWIVGAVWCATVLVGHCLYRWIRGRSGDTKLPPKAVDSRRSSDRADANPKYEY